MTQLSSEKYNIAWFKLAEFVIRKEKERALYMYRLLVHSLPDEAFAAQLEGDLLHSFNDPKAFDCYVRAAIMYQKKGKHIEAIALYENLMIISGSQEYSLKLLSIVLNTNPVDHEYIKQVIVKVLERGTPEKNKEFIESLQALDSQAYTFAQDYTKK